MDDNYLDVIREQAAEFGAGWAGRYDDYQSRETTYDDVVVAARERLEREASEDALTRQLSDQTLYIAPDRVAEGQTITSIELRGNGREYGLCNYHLNGQDFLYVVLRNLYVPDLWSVVG